MRNVTIFIFITIFSLAWAGTAQAQTCDTSWGTPVDGNWTDATKWTAGVPSATTVACIEVDGDYEVSVSGTNKAKALVLGLASGTGTPTLTFSSGTLTLFEASVVRSTGQLNWSGGTLAGTLTNEGLLRLTSSSSKTLGAGSTLTNDGTIEHELGNFVFQPDAKVVNNATFDLQGDADLWVQFDGNRRFENNGLFKKSVGTGESIVSRASGGALLNFYNNPNGIVSAEAGTIRADGPFAHAEDALIQGVATVEFASGTLTHAGDTGPGLSPGVLNWTGTFNPQPTATFTVDIAGSGGAGATNGHDQLVVTSSAALDGQIQVNLLDSFVPTQGQQFEVLTASSVSGAFTNPNTNDQIYAGNGVAFTVKYESDKVVLEADLLEADIALDKTVSPAVVDVGQTATFTVTASKDNDADDLNAFGLEEDIVIKDILPSGLSLVNASAGSYDPATGEWLLPELLSGANETLTLEVTVDAAGIFENTATLQAAELPDPNDANDSRRTRPTSWSWTRSQRGLTALRCDRRTVDSLAKRLYDA